MTLKERLLDIQIDLAEAYKYSGVENKNKEAEIYCLNSFQNSIQKHLFEWVASPVTFTEENLPSIAELCKRHSYIIEAKSIEDFYFNLNKWLFKAEDLDTPNFPTVVLVSILAVQNYYRNLILKTYDNYNS